MIDETHDPAARSWVPGADAHQDFPLQNLPFGLYSLGGGEPRAGVAIGDFVLDLSGATSLLADRLHLDIVEASRQPSLNALFALVPESRRQLRRALFDLLADAKWQEAAAGLLHGMEQCDLLLPLQVRDYTDFYAGIHHARAVGSLLRPENPLLPNYKYVPVGYHGRSSSIRPSGSPVIRPQGQILSPETKVPALGPSRRLDYEVELAIWLGGRSQLGEPVPIASANEHIAGFGLLNDWSARDLQTWEYQPLGPFLAKNFATTVSPWVVTLEALAPFRNAPLPRPEGDPAPLPYLDASDPAANDAFDITIEVSLQSARMKAEGVPAARMGLTSAMHLYWTPAQFVAHHSVNGCDLAAGDLLGSGTISGPTDDSRGSLMELSRGGKQQIRLPNGETRTFLEDGDQVTLTGWAERAGYRRIGFGQCSATIIGNAGAPVQN